MSWPCTELRVSSFSSPTTPFQRLVERAGDLQISGKLARTAGTALLVPRGLSLNAEAYASNAMTQLVSHRLQGKLASMTLAHT